MEPAPAPPPVPPSPLPRPRDGRYAQRGMTTDPTTEAALARDPAALRDALIARDRWRPPTRRRSRRPRPGPRQPDRRAHRLQRRLRAPGRHRPRDLDRPRPDRRRPRRADPGGDRRDGRVRCRRGRPAARRPGSTTSPGMAWALAASGHGPAWVPRPARVGPAAGRRAVVVGGDRGRLGVGALGRGPAAGRPDGPRPRRQARRERLHRPQQRDHGPVRVDLRRAASRAAARLPLARAPVDPAAARRRHARRVPLRLAAQARDVRLQRAPRRSASRPWRRSPRSIPRSRSLRDVTPAMLAEVRDRLDDVPARRAEHIVEENGRVLATHRGLRGGRPRRGRPPVLRQPRLAARPVRGQQPRARRPRRHRAGDAGRHRRPADGRGLRRLHDQPRAQRRGRTAARGRVPRLSGANRPRRHACSPSRPRRARAGSADGGPRVRPARGPPDARGAPSRGGARRRRTASGRPSPGTSR